MMSALPQLWRPIGRTALLVLLGFVATLATGELLARGLMPEAKLDSCVVRAGLVRPHCVSRTKLAEGPWVENHYNECGYKALTSCLQRPPNQGARVVLMGTSVANGYGVPQADGLAEQTMRLLSPLCGRTVDVQALNLYLPTAPDPHLEAGIDAKLAQVRALRPQSVVIAVSSFDLANYAEPSPSARAPQSAAGSSSGPVGRLKPMLRDAKAKVVELRERSRLILAVRHFAFKDPDTQVRLYLSNTDASGYLRADLTPAWRARLGLLDRALSRVSAGLAADQVDLVLFYVPFAAAPTILAHDLKHAGVAPLGFERELEALAGRHGARFVSASAAFVASGAPLDLYYVVDGHPNARGARLAARSLGQGLTPAGPASPICAAAP